MATNEAGETVPAVGEIVSTPFGLRRIAVVPDPIGAGPWVVAFRGWDGQIAQITVATFVADVWVEAAP